MNDSALLATAKANDVTILADQDHGDGNIAAHVQAQLPALVAAGVKDLYLEHDAKDVWVEDLIRDGGPYGQMIAEAEKLGVRMHLYDDRSEQRAIEAHFPEAAAFAKTHDTYLENPDQLIANAPNPDAMRSFVEAKQAQLGNLDARNTSIIDMIDREVKAQPDSDKALVILGGAHLGQHRDVDEGLRALGHQVATIEINSPNSMLPLTRGPDLPDVIAATETGQAVAFKAEADAPTLTRATPEAGPDWRNHEPVASSPMAALIGGLDLSALAQCSHNAGQPCQIADTGHLAQPITHQTTLTSEITGRQ